MNNAVIAGTGSYLPKQIITNKDLESKIDTSDEWIQSRTGISARRVANAEETVAYMAGQAALNALENARMKADDVDMILVATCTPSHFFPSMAAQVLDTIGIKKHIPAFDLSAACSGFIYAMDVALQYIRANAAKHILVIGSENMSKAVDWEDRRSCILFGDGAGAVVLSASQHEPGILGSVLHAMYDKEQLLCLENATPLNQASYIGMKGNDVFKIAVKLMTGIVDEVLEKCKLQQSDIKWLIPHQANIRIIQAIAKKLNLPMSQVILTIAEQGNTSAASIPLALDDAHRSGKIQRGDVILLESFGGGMTWGACVVQF